VGGVVVAGGGGGRGGGGCGCGLGGLSGLDGLRTVKGAGGCDVGLGFGAVEVGAGGEGNEVDVAWS
jgi:hypothetical protein